MGLNHRYIVIVGRKGAGKATLGNFILGKNEFAAGWASNGDEQDDKKSRVCENIQVGGLWYSVLLVNTVYSYASGYNYKTTIEEIKRTLNSWKQLDLLFFLRSAETRAYQDDKTAENYIINHFNPWISSISILAFNHCDPENLNAVKSIKEHAALKHLTKFTKCAIITVNFSDSVTTNVRNAETESSQKKIQSLLNGYNTNNRILLQDIFKPVWREKNYKYVIVAAAAVVFLMFVFFAFFLPLYYNSEGTFLPTKYSLHYVLQ